MPPPNADDPLRTTDHKLESASTKPPQSDPNATVSFVPTTPMPTDHWLVGKTVPGYEILEVLGRGGMGVVYKANHLALKRIVALKMVLAGGHAGPRELARFRIEAEAVARLQHPNIVQIHEVGEVDGHPYCALEFVEGGNLAAKIDGKPLPARESARLVEALARAMQLAHSRNVVHRDLKPANILLAVGQAFQPDTGVRLESLTYIPKITDFGLARQLDSDSGETQAGSVLGTPSYMAPEQASGQAHDAGPAADVYALGAILYECLAGRPPFKGKTVVETLDQVRTQEPVPPSRSQPNVPLDLETICLKCLRKESEKRYASAAELADDLVRYQRGEPIEARPVGAVERAAKWVRRHPATAALIAAVALLLLGTTAFSLLLAESERQTAADLARYNNDLRREQREKDAALKAVRVGAARLALDRGLILCDQGDIARGLVALTRALAAAVEAGDADLEGAVRFNLAAWERHMWRLRAILPGSEGTQVRAAALNPQGTVLAVALANKTTQLWDARADSAGRVLHTLPHEGLVVDLNFSAAGRLLMTRTDRVVHLWNVADGKPACAPLRHESRVLTAALAPDGKLILTGEEKGAAHLWGAATGQHQCALAHKAVVEAVAFRADGLRALTGSRDGKVHVWKIPTGQADGVAFALKSWVTTARFSPDGKIVLAGTKTGKVHLLDAATGNSVCDPLEHDGPIEDMVLGGPKGTTLAVRTKDLQGILDRLSGKSASVFAKAHLWHAVTGSQITPPLAHPGNVRCFAFSPDGQTLLTAGKGGAARFWDTSRGVVAGPPLYHQREVWAAAFSRDGHTLMTLDGVVRLWQAPRGFRRGPPLAHAGGAYAVAFSRDGKLALTAGEDRTARLWHSATGKPAAEPLQHEVTVLAVAFSPDGRLALTGGGTKGRLWDSTTGKLRAVLEGHQAAIAAVAFGPDGSTVLTGSFDKSARLWDVATGQPLGGPLRHEGPVQAVAFSPDGQSVLTGSDDKTARLWRVATRLPVGEPMPHQVAVEAVAFATDGRMAYTGDRTGKEVRCWDTASGQASAGLTGHQAGVRALALAPAGHLVLSGSYDRTARFWNPETGKQVGLPLQHQDTVRDVAFGPDGCSALTGSFDTTARRWHAPTGIPIGPPFLHRGKIRAVALSADGRTAGTASWDGTAMLWEAPPALPGTPEQIALWAQVITGIDLDDGGGVRTLDEAAWQECRRRGKLPGRGKSEVNLPLN